MRFRCTILLAVCALVLLQSSRAELSFEVKVLKSVPGRPGQQDVEASMSSTADPNLRVDFGDIEIHAIPLASDQDGQHFVPGDTVPGNLILRRSMGPMEIIMGISHIQRWYEEAMECVTSEDCQQWEGSVLAVRRDVTVSVINVVQGQPERLTALRYYSCWPVRWEPPELLVDGSPVDAVETVELNCANMDIVPADQDASIANTRRQFSAPPMSCEVVHAAAMQNGEQYNTSAPPQVRPHIMVLPSEYPCCGGPPPPMTASGFSFIHGGAMGLSTSIKTKVRKSGGVAITVRGERGLPLYLLGGSDDDGDGAPVELSATPFSASLPGPIDDDDDADGLGDERGAEDDAASDECCSDDTARQRARLARLRARRERARMRAEQRRRRQARRRAALAARRRNRMRRANTWTHVAVTHDAGLMRRSGNWTRARGEHILLARQWGLTSPKDTKRTTSRTLETITLEGPFEEVSATVASWLDDARVAGSISLLMGDFGELLDLVQDEGDSRFAFSVDSFFDIFTELSRMRDTNSSSTSMQDFFDIFTEVTVSGGQYLTGGGNRITIQGENFKKCGSSSGSRCAASPSPSTSSSLFTSVQGPYQLTSSQGPYQLTSSQGPYQFTGTPGTSGSPIDQCDDGNDGFVPPFKKRIDKASPLLARRQTDANLAESGAAPNAGATIEVDQCPAGSYACWDGTCRTRQAWCPAPSSAQEWSAWRSVVELQVYSVLRGEPDALQRGCCSGMATGKRQHTMGMRQVQHGTIATLSFMSGKKEMCTAPTKVYEGAFPTMLHLPPLDAATINPEPVPGDDTAVTPIHWTLEVRVDRIEMK